MYRVRTLSRDNFLTFLILILLTGLTACASGLQRAQPLPSPQPYPGELPTSTAVVAFPTPDKLNETGTSQSGAAPQTPAPQTPAVSPQVALYDLGERTIIQANFPESSRFHNMPVRLEGIVGVPAAEGQYPVILILHGNHPGCPVNEFGVDAWPCAPEDERQNYRGFEYLVSDLAARGYVALAININAEYTFGFGEPIPGERLGQLVDEHLAALEMAGSGGANEFGVPLDGRIDLSRLVWIGHSQGGELGAMLIRDRQLNTTGGAESAGYGPVRGLLQIAPAVVSASPSPLADIPLAVILPSCDGDVVGLDGQYFFEAARDDRARTSIATSAYLEGASHNGFNSTLPVETLPGWRNPECATDFLLDPAAQRSFLTAYTVDFLTLALDEGAPAQEAAAQLGLDISQPAPQELYGEIADPLVSPPPDDELLLIRPFSESELGEDLLGGSVTLRNATATYCPGGFFTDSEEPGRRACRRTTVNQPGLPAQFALSWQNTGASLQLAIPDAEQDLRRFAALRLRAALDPLSDLNSQGSGLELTVRIRDLLGVESTALIDLPWPAGERMVDSTSNLETFSGHVHMRDFRLPLRIFSGVDLAHVSEIALDFDKEASGAVFLADMGLVRELRFFGSHSTLLDNSDDFLNPLRGVGRFNGNIPCTAVLVDSGGDPGAQAYALTSGRCVQGSDATAVLPDQPAKNLAVEFNFFVDADDERVWAPVKQIVYATTQGRDLAVLELTPTLGALAYLGVMPLQIAGGKVDSETQLQVISAPIQEGHPESSYLRHELCHLNGRAGIVEGLSLFYSVYRTDCQDITAGSVGAPVFAGSGDAVAALISTSTVDAPATCALGAPCEFGEFGTSLQLNTTYATAIDGLAMCFAADGRFNLELTECPLRE